MPKKKLKAILPIYDNMTERPDLGKDVFEVKGEHGRLIAITNLGNLTHEQKEAIKAVLKRQKRPPVNLSW